METGYKVIDAMTVKPITADPEMMLRDVAKLMRDKGIGSLLFTFLLSMRISLPVSLL
jgi:CBS domain-containing protein